MLDLDRRKQAYAYGRKCRQETRRNKHGRWKPAKGRDPLDILHTVLRGRLRQLLPIRAERMRASPFAFFRGAAAIMAADLASLPRSGIIAQICGDAHILNLGSYAAPDGRVVFDINDFDETIEAPWEWDAKRLATSLVLGGSENGDSKEDCTQAVLSFAASYRASMHSLCQLSALELARYQVHRHLHALPAESVLHQAQRATPQENLHKLAVELKKGRWQFRNQRPLLFPVAGDEEKQVLSALQSYRKTLAPDRQHLFDSYRTAAVGFKVVGIGSVGVRDYIVLLFGRDADDPLLLQVKEEPPSCYIKHLNRPPKVAHEGQRVVQGQRLLQAQSDLLLGWTSLQGRDYLVRQLADHKASIDMKTLRGSALRQYAELCGEVLAKGHARSADPCAIAGYLGASQQFDDALAQFAHAYAAQTEKDLQDFVRANRKHGKQAPAKTIE